MKKVISILLISTIVLSCCFVFTSCIGANSIVGKWTPDQTTNSNYPEKCLILDDDGTGNIDGYSCTWVTEGDELTIIATNGFAQKTVTYKYNVSFDNLTLDNFSFTRR